MIRLDGLLTQLKDIGDQTIIRKKLTFDELETLVNTLADEADIFICDGCGLAKSYEIDKPITVCTPNLSGIVMCKDCMK